MVHKWQEISKTICDDFFILSIQWTKNACLNLKMRTKTDYDLQLILDTFCQFTIHFDGAVIFWTLLDHLDQCVLIQNFQI